jgi:hypothetical protein
MTDSNEDVWQRLADPNPLLESLRRLKTHRTAAGRRKLRLFLCACCRRGWDFLQMEPGLRDAVECAEAVADGKEKSRELQRVQQDCLDRHTAFLRARGNRAPLTCLSLAISCACEPTPDPWFSGVCDHLGTALGHDSVSDYPAQSALLRCIFGNPFRPVAFDPRWRTETAVALATGIYEHRAFDRLPILADALEEAGCDQPDVLAHCRQPDGLHARGCWVVDGVLGKA